MKLDTKLKQNLIDWYWNYGSKRSGAYSLTRGGWLDRALRIIRDTESVEKAKTKYDKPTMALWGPSQSGKSTLLACFIDAGVDHGFGNALKWDDSPVQPRFSGDNEGGTVPVLNPFNFGEDGSGCVTRFHMVDAVEHPDYPVEIQFASEREILLSLAVGYMGETSAKDSTGKLRTLRPEDLKDILAVTGPRKPRVEPDKNAFFLLTEVLNVIDVLIDMESPRYVNLKSEWADRRSNILNDNNLISSEENVERFASEILWDSWKNLSELYRRLRARRATLVKKRYFCNIELAALLLNISSAKHYNESDYVRTLVNSCTVVDIDDESAAITQKIGAPLFTNHIDFALTQGLVSLIVVPLKRSIIEQTNEDVYKLLDKADLLDFPGVANEYKSAVLLTDEQLALEYCDENGRCPLLALTQVMKRGKTASIVISSARELNIDVFSLLVRMPAGPTYPANPVQIMNGIRYWFKTMGKASNPLSRDRELQINLILTFSAKLLNLVNENGTGTAGLNGVFDKLKSLGDLADPSVVTSFSINYPDFSDGHIENMDEARKREVIEMILKDRHFSRQFAGTEESLSHMADFNENEFGGRSYLFRSMLEQLDKSKRPELLDAKLEALAAEWTDCMAEALPGHEEEEASRNKDIDMMIEALEKNPNADSDESIAKQIIDFQDVSPEVLEILPRAQTDVPDYVDRQVVAWMEAAKRKTLQRLLGFESAEHRARVLSYIMSDMDTTVIAKWLVPVVRPLSREERREWRRLVATYIVKLAFPNDLPHRSEEASVTLLERISDNAYTSREHVNREDSTYFISVVAPFISYLRRLRDNDAPDKSRGEQPGDKELAELVSNL